MRKYLYPAGLVLAGMLVGYVICLVVNKECNKDTAIYNSTEYNDSTVAETIDTIKVTEFAENKVDSPVVDTTEFMN